MWHVAVSETGVHPSGQLYGEHDDKQKALGGFQINQCGSANPLRMGWRQGVKYNPRRHLDPLL